MKIAFFTDTYVPTVDGIVRSIVGYKKELEKRGHEVFIFCPGTKKQKKENTDKNIYYFTSTTFKPYPDYRLAIFPFFSAVKKAKEYKIDLIHSHGVATTGLAAIQCSKKLKIPLLASFHTLVPEGVHYLVKNRKIQDFFKSVAWKYLKWYYSHFNTIIVPSNYVKKILLDNGLNNLTVNPTGIDNTIFGKTNNGKKIRSKYKIGTSPLIIHVGRVALEKRLEVLIDAANNILNTHPKSKFMIIGKGPAREHYEQLVQSKGLSKNFIFTGYVDDSDLSNYYSAADVFVFPSDFDTQGLVILESLSMGTPVVARTNSASSEFIEDGKTGYLFSDHFDLPGKISSALKNKDELKLNIKKQKNKYTLKNSTDRLLEIYDSKLSSL